MEQVFFVGSVEPVVRVLRQEPVTKAAENRPEDNRDDQHDPDVKKRIQDHPDVGGLGVWVLERKIANGGLIRL